MKRLFITCLSVIFLLTAFSGSVLSQQKAKADKKDGDDDNDWSFGGNHTPGTWDAAIKGDQINIQLYGPHWSSGRSFPVAELSVLPDGKIGEFTLTREAGKMTFKGVFQSHFGHGSYQFTENAGYKTYMAQLGYKGIDSELLLNMFFTDINKAYFDYLRTNGYTKINNEELKDLAEQGMTHKVLADYFELFRTENYGHQPIDKLVELHEHGVNPQFVRSFHEAGFKTVPLDKALELRDHGVSPAFIAEFKKMGYGNISLDQAQDLRDHGVNPQFISSIQNMGYKNVTLDKAQDLRDHGVNPEFIKGIQALGFKDLSLDQAQELRDHGVTIAYIQKTKAKGLSNIHTLDDYIRLKDTGF
jgi:hypothetical protein